MTTHPHQIKWVEPGELESVYVLAEHTASGWKFYAKDGWDTCWRHAESNADRINKAEKLKAKELTRQSDKEDIESAHLFTTIPSDGHIPSQLMNDSWFPLPQPPRLRQTTLRLWQQPTIVVIGLALLLSGGVAISSGWQVALVVHLMDLAALIWGRQKGLY
ncbi:MAG TPA: hypothetical protein VJ810_32460 [Blastocatellia bacterium]|nr:hypothetical protein [Blastocatellia bacterium]